MTLLVDTSVWSLALRRDVPSMGPEVRALHAALQGGDVVVTTGLILQELLQGFAGAKDRSKIIANFAALAMVQPDRDDHIGAAELRNTCRRGGVQLTTVDALIAHLCVRHEMVLLTADNDFSHAAKHTKLQVWSAT